MPARSSALNTTKGSKKYKQGNYKTDLIGQRARTNKSGNWLVPVEERQEAKLVATQ